MLGMQRSHRLITSATALVLSAGAASAVPPLQHYYGVLPSTGAVQTYTDQITAAAQVKWYAFAISESVNAAEGTYLDIDTNANPAQAPALVDTVLGVYNAAGQLVSGDDDSGTGNRSQISFGAGSRSAPGNGLVYDGQNGATLNVAQGPFFIAVSGYSASYGPNFGATSSSTDLGYFTLGLRAGKMPGFTPTVDADLGNIRGHRSSMSTGAMPVAIGEVKWVKFHIDAPTDASTIYCDIQTAGSNLPVANGSNLNDAELALFRSDGTVVSGAANGNADDWTFGGGTYQGGASFGRTTGARAYGSGLNNFAGQTAAVLIQGDYYVAVGAYNLAPLNGFVAGSDTDASGTVTLTVTTNIAPAQDYDMGVIRALNSPQTTTPIPMGDGETKWYRFEIQQATSAATTYCDIHTLGSTLVQGAGIKNDTMIAVYDTSGAVKGFNDDWSGRTTGGNESGLSFGRVSGPRAYGGLPTFVGQDGAVLPAGVYYVGVTAFSDSYATSGDYRLNSQHTRHGNVQLTIATNIGASADVDFGTVSRNNAPVGVSSMSLPAGSVRWVHFRTVASTNASTYYLDLHTLGSVLNNNNDTWIGLYNAQGQRLDQNDDWPFGPGLESGMSFGMTSPTRTYSPFVNFAGQDGADLYAGHYYVAIAPIGATFGASDFNVTNQTSATGSISLTIITNLPATPCNLADVASLGGTPGADGVLTVDDIVFFLSRFFGADMAVADVATLGGTPGSDGAITVDDLVVFLAAFFSPCNP